MKTQSLLAISALGLFLSACDHKDLVYEFPDAGNVRVIFDWSNAPQAAPEAMEADFFDSESHSPVRFIFQGRDGGTIHIGYGDYSVIGLNCDNTDCFRMRNTGSLETFEIYTPDAENLEAQGLEISALPSGRASSAERIARTPTALYGDRRDGQHLELTADEQTVTLYPREVTCHYHVTVLNVENIQNLDGAAIDATLSGMAEGYYHGKQKPTENPVTMPFTLKPEEGKNALEGHFLTFGECSESNFTHSLIVYMVYSDGTQSYQTFDVTDQVRNAPDPHNVDIIVSGLRIPRHVDSGGGFAPRVDNWQSTDIDLKM